jgi:hypothetical protein
MPMSLANEKKEKNAIFVYFLPDLVKSFYRKRPPPRRCRSPEAQNDPNNEC